MERKPVHLAINGQTGKIVGDLPMDKNAFWKWMLGTGRRGVCGCVCTELSGLAAVRRCVCRKRTIFSVILALILVMNLAVCAAAQRIPFVFMTRRIF